jgi:hypothetical protein
MAIEWDGAFAFDLLFDFWLRENLTGVYQMAIPHCLTTDESTTGH